MSDSSDTVPAVDAIAHYVGKWQAREPEMRVLPVFCAPEEQYRLLAWGALLHELREALFELSDARVTGVKCGWWAEELIGMGQGRHRHPLTEVLSAQAAPWPALGRALLDAVGDESRPADTAEAIAALLPLARAVIAVETALFAVDGKEPAARALAIHWLLQRLPQGLAAEDQARLPMHLLARHGLSLSQIAAGQGEALLRDWAGELATELARCPGPAALIRRGRRRFDAARLARLASGRGFSEPLPPATLWRAWRAARDA
ncbi:hypothetical protein [Arenimonas oryziterrae]|uniref:Phytoene synthase n=1 Tax=Arenimonas oryziterrae DSM 21050 = YC6267 TaxID=1121015 RepID=A0A091B121_9GAMM|nr:hypothetical protein [Arenimonas oryziterrae]KFN44559.1 hypothetical protein N789_00700 [Arenimonas oryziterrae DSM 21050 = YC6267]